MLKAGLHLQLGQSLTMTPQLQQAIRLLQLSSLELQTEIQTFLENNPMLETAEDEDSSGNGTSTDGDIPGVEGDADSRHAEPSGNDPESAAVDREDPGEAEPREASSNDLDDDLPSDGRWEDAYDQPNSATRHGESDDRDPFENQASHGGGLHEHLLWQIHLSPLGERERDMAVFIVDSIQADGLLESPLDEIYVAYRTQRAAENEQSFPAEGDSEFDVFRSVQSWLQRLDPQGCATATLQECLLVQIEPEADARLPTDPAPDEASIRLARKILTDGFDRLARRDHRGLARQFGERADAIATAVAIIQQLDPRPGTRYSDTQTEYIAPDVYIVHRAGHGWEARLNPDASPNLRINELYARYARESKTARDTEYLRSNLQEARWFLKSLQARNETLLRVAQAIVDRQRGFFELGEVGMQPMVLRDIGDTLSLHESTISRVTQGKYMHTPRGLFEFKYFFSSHVGTEDGGECSATAIRAMIRTLIEAEDPHAPLSDARLAEILRERGIHVARRTVAKYREGLGIPSSSGRRVTV